MPLCTFKQWGRHHSLFKLTIIMHDNHTDNYKMANDLMCINENYLGLRFTQWDALYNEIRVIADKH